MSAATAENYYAKKETTVAVRIDTAVYRKLSTVAAWKGKGIAEYLSEIAGPVVERELLKIIPQSREEMD